MSQDKKQRLEHLALQPLAYIDMVQSLSEPDSWSPHQGQK